MTPQNLADLIDHQQTERPDADAIAAFERSLGASLPEDYRRFLAMMPGGKLDGVVTFPIGVDRDFLACVYGLGAQGRCALAERTHRNREDGVLPQGLLQIMEGRGGDAIALATDPDRLGEVFFVDHEVAEDDGPPTLADAESEDWGYAISLAPSFTAFLAGFAIEEA